VLRYTVFDYTHVAHCAHIHTMHALYVVKNLTLMIIYLHNNRPINTVLMYLLFVHSESHVTMCNERATLNVKRRYLCIKILVRFPFLLRFFILFRLVARFQYLTVSSSYGPECAVIPRSHHHIHRAVRSFTAVPGGRVTFFYDSCRAGHISNRQFRAGRFARRSFAQRVISMRAR